MTLRGRAACAPITPLRFAPPPPFRGLKWKWRVRAMAGVPSRCARPRLAALVTCHCYPALPPLLALHPASASLPAPRQKREGNGKRGLESWQGMGCHRIRCSGAHCRPDQAREGFPKSVANNQHHNQGGNLTRPTSSLCEAVRYLYRRGWAMQEIGALFIQWG